MFCTKKLRALALVWCNGDPIEKAEEMYDILQNNKQDYLAACDRDFKPTLFKMLEFSSSMVYKLEPKYGDKSLGASESVL